MSDLSFNARAYLRLLRWEAADAPDPAPPLKMNNTALIKASDELLEHGYIEHAAVGPFVHLTPKGAEWRDEPPREQRAGRGGWEW